MSTGNGTILARASPPTLDNADKPIKQTPDKQAVLQTVSVMKNKRTTYEKRWKSIRDYQLPFLGVFSDTADETDRGRRRDTEIANGVAWLSNQAFAAGVMSGLTPPSRQWFKFGFSDGTEGDVEAEQVLDERQAILEAFLHRSNFYNSIHTIYMELPFGQAPLGVFSSPQTGIRFQPYTIGTYYLGANGSGQINTFARRIQMTAAQIVEQFGADNLPQSIRDALKNKSAKFSKEFNVWWLVRPNDKRISGQIGSKNMPFQSLYWVEGQEETENGGFLHVGGFHEFPVLTARYQVTDIDAYGKGPGWYAEGDAKALQKMKKDFLIACDMLVKPPMKGPSTLMNTGINMIPGGVTYVNETTASNTVTPLFQIQSNPTFLAEEIIRTEQDIKRIYSADLFLMLDQVNTPQMTAREVMERQQEKLQQLGPVVERLQDEFLSPIIERAYNILERMGAFPPISDDLLMRMQDKEIKIEYISPLAQAQKMSGLVNIEQALSFVGQMVQLYPEVRNMVDPLGTTRRYFELLGAPASMQRPEEEVQAIMKQEQQAMQEQQQMQAQQQMAQTAAPAAQAAKNLTEAANDGNPALTQLLGMGTPEG